MIAAVPAKLRLVKPTRVRPLQVLQCPRCKGREVIETRIGVQMLNGRPTRGTKVLLCAQCMRTGERVPLA